MYVYYNTSLTVNAEEAEGEVEKSKILLFLIKNVSRVTKLFICHTKNLPNYNTQFADTLNRFPDKNRAQIITRLAGWMVGSLCRCVRRKR